MSFSLRIKMAILKPIRFHIYYGDIGVISFFFLLPPTKMIISLTVYGEQIFPNAPIAFCSIIRHIIILYTFWIKLKKISLNRFYFRYNEHKNFSMFPNAIKIQSCVHYNNYVIYVYVFGGKIHPDKRSRIIL